jgi:hypothetical protein
VAFIAPASKTYVPAQVLAEQRLDQAHRVDYVAARDTGKDAGQRGTWHVAQDTMTLAGPRKKDPILALRRIFVHSSARAQAAATTQANKLQRARDDLARLERGLGGRHYPTERAVADRVTAIGRARRVTTYLIAATSTDPATGKPTLTWHFDQNAIDAEAATDGWYALLTNLPPDTADAEQVLRHYKGQEPPPGLQRPTGRHPPVPEEQPPHQRADHRHLPVPAHLLPDRTPSPPSTRRPGQNQGQRLVRRTTRHSHRHAHPQRIGRHPAHPGHRPITPDHPPTHRPPTPSPGPSRHRSTRPPLKITHMRKTGLAS